MGAEYYFLYIEPSFNSLDQNTNKYLLTTFVKTDSKNLKKNLFSPKIRKYHVVYCTISIIAIVWLSVSPTYFAAQ